MIESIFRRKLNVYLQVTDLDTARECETILLKSPVVAKEPVFCSKDVFAVLSETKADSSETEHVFIK